MKRLALPFAALAALALPAPLQAQDGAREKAEVAFKCAIWASYFNLAYEGRPEATGLAYATNYFVGLYEGLTGHGIDVAIDEQLVIVTANTLDELTPLCTAQMDAYGTRMAEWGESLQKIAEQIPENGSPS